MSATNDLLDGLAQLLADAGVASYTPAGVYTVDQTGVFFSLMPAGAEGAPPGPDRCVVLSAYALSDQPGLPLGQITVQVRTRGLEDPRDVTALSDAVYDLFQGLTDRTFGSVHLIQMLRKSSLPMGQDTNRRWQQSQNYTCDVDLPATVNRPVGGSY